MDRVRWWKDEAERRFLAGDMKGFAEAEAHLEAYRMKAEMEQRERANAMNPAE